MNDNGEFAIPKTKDDFYSCVTAVLSEELIKGVQGLSGFTLRGHDFFTEISVNINGSPYVTWMASFNNIAERANWFPNGEEDRVSNFNTYLRFEARKAVELLRLLVQASEDYRSKAGK